MPTDPTPERAEKPKPTFLRTKEEVEIDTLRAELLRLRSECERLRAALEGIEQVALGVRSHPAKQVDVLRTTASVALALAAKDAPDGE